MKHKSAENSDKVNGVEALKKYPFFSLLFIICFPLSAYFIVLALSGETHGKFSLIYLAGFIFTATGSLVSWWNLRDKVQ